MVGYHSLTNKREAVMSMEQSRLVLSILNLYIWIFISVDVNFMKPLLQIQWCVYMPQLIKFKQ